MKLVQQKQYLFQLLAMGALVFLCQCNKSSGGSSSPAPAAPPPPPPPPTFVSTLNLTTPIPPEISVESEIPNGNINALPNNVYNSSNTNIDSDLYIQPGLANNVVMHYEMQTPGVAPQKMDLNFEVKILKFDYDEIEVSKKVLSSQYQNSYWNGPFAELKPTRKIYDVEKLKNVLTTDGLRYNLNPSYIQTINIPNSSVYNYNPSTPNTNPISIPKMNLTGNLCTYYPSANPQTHFYAGHYRPLPPPALMPIIPPSASGRRDGRGPVIPNGNLPAPQAPQLPAAPVPNPSVASAPIPAVIIRKIQPMKGSCINPYAMTGTPAAPAPVPVPTAPAPLDFQYEEVTVIVPNAKVITNFNNSEYDDTVLFHGSTLNSSNGQFINKNSIYIQAPAL